MEHEMVDLLDENGNKTGEVDKAIAHKLGLWHKSVHVWIINDKNKILLQKRCADKSFYPNYWDCSVAGHIGANEDPLDTAVREAKEEIGIDIDKSKLKPAFVVKESLKWNDIISNEFVFVYVVYDNINLTDLKFQKEEVAGAKFVGVEDFFKHSMASDIFPHENEYKLLKSYINRLSRSK